MSAALAPYIQKLDAALAEKNIFTDYLNIAEAKTGLPKRNVVLGKLFRLLLNHSALVQLQYLILCQFFWDSRLIFRLPDLTDCYFNWYR